LHLSLRLEDAALTSGGKVGCVIIKNVARVGRDESLELITCIDKFHDKSIITYHLIEF